MTVWTLKAGGIIWIVLAAFAALVTLNLAGQGAFLLSRLP